jgi:hypothetical protein
VFREILGLCEKIEN